MVKMMAVDANMFESVGYAMSKRELFVKFRNSHTVCFEGVPGFRYQGLLSAPRKDAYFKTYIQNQFLSKEVPSAPG
jgi:KTSC domain